MARRLQHACPRGGVLLVAALSALAVACSESAVRRPNVVLVVVDTLRSDRLSCYGYPRPTSPWLERMAAEGTLFEDVTAQAGWTLPSMVSLFTSRYLTAYSESIPPSVPSLPQVFQQAGYRTVGVVANLSVNHLAGFDRGFDVYDLRAAPPQEGDTGDRPRTVDALATDLWSALDEVPSEKARAPLFLFFFPFDPHDPYYKKPQYDDELAPEGTPDEALTAWQRERLAGHPAAAPEVDPDWEKHLAHIRRQRGYYDQEVRFTDDVLEGVFTELERRGILEDAVVAFVSDHGEGLWEHVALEAPEELDTATPLELFYQKHGAHLYQEAIATPFVLWGRGVPAGRRIAAAVENVDLFPTLVELAGVEAPAGLHGRSLVPFLEGAAGDEGSAAQRESVHAFLYHQVSVREVASGWKLIRPTDVEKRVEPEPQLFHLPSDPDERVNLYAERPGEVERLEALLADWMRRFPAPEGWTSASGDQQLQILRNLGYTDEDLGRETGPSDGRTEE